MKTKKVFVWVGFVLAAMGVAAVIKSRIVAPSQPSADEGAGADNSSVVDSGADLLVQAPATSGKTIQNAAGGFSLTTPDDWYLERNDSSGVAVYPDYDPKSDTAPDCKIQISDVTKLGSSAQSAQTVPTGRAGLDAFVTAALHADPTADVAESAREAISAGGQPAVEWQGSLNGVTTTLVYILAHGKVFEIAPSNFDGSVDGSGESAGDDGGDCGLALDAVIESIQF